MNFISLLLYDTGIFFYGMAITISSLWNEKARLWRDGRKNQFEQINKLDKNEYRVWFHCASVGEFEQGRPLMEAYRKQWPQHKIVLTFFSPSGFELRKNYSGVDYIFYLPLDTRYNAHKFVDAIQPNLSVFVKYEFWYHYLSELKNRNIPALLISGIFRRNQPFFQWYGALWRKMLHFFQKLFLQDEPSLQLLRSIDINNAEVAGDTRFDRVWEISQSPQKLPLVEIFKGQEKLFVAGSTWPMDEQILDDLVNSSQPGWKWVIVPHEIDTGHLRRINDRWREQLCNYSQAGNEKLSSRKILLIDKVGLLSSVYSYADMAYIGGGFGKGIHNVLEAAVFGIPLIFGPNYHRFNEANELLQHGAAKSVKSNSELKQAFEIFAGKESSFGIVNKNYVQEKKGATQRIMNYLRDINAGNAASPA